MLRAFRLSTLFAAANGWAQSVRQRASRGAVLSHAPPVATQSPDAQTAWSALRDPQPDDTSAVIRGVFTYHLSPITYHLLVRFHENVCLGLSRRLDDHRLHENRTRSRAGARPGRSATGAPA